jgi:UPF0755 protein
VKTLKKLTAILLICIGTLALAAGIYFRGDLYTPYPEVPGNIVLEIPERSGTREVLRVLKDKNVIRSEYVALAYLIYTRQQGRLQAGEYLFDRPMTLPDVMTRLVKGSVLLHRFTVPEGLTLKETAGQWESQKYGPAQDFMEAAAASVDLVHAFDDKATSLEGYLFPETYSFPSRTTARQVIQAMVNRFHSVIDELKQKHAADTWPLNLRETVILASLVETEAYDGSERPTIASVYMNRLGRRMLLQCDPTVIYALELEGKYRGRLRSADLKFPSPYNTYANAGLPPGPIANPGYASLEAAIRPATTKYFFFVRTTKGQHTFSETLAEHNRAVAAYRKMLRTRPDGKT